MMFKVMLTKCFTVLTFALILASAAIADDGLGQTIQIRTRLNSFVGKPMWLLTIRDVDHNQSIPYIFNIERGENYLVATTGGRNYLIEISNLQMSSYQLRYNTFKYYRISNFCRIESQGRIIRGKSMFITIQGDLAPNSEAYTCNVTSFPVSNFTVVNSSDD
jgi:hypothetical protein